MTPQNSTPQDRSVIIRLNIGENDHHWVTEEEALREARKLIDDPEPTCLTLERRLQRTTITPRQWRELARDIDHLVREAAKVEGSVRYVIFGRAFLPVFAYLGSRMVRIGPVYLPSLYNGEWEVFPPPRECPSGGRDDFEFESAGRNKSKGRVALSVRTSNELGVQEDSLYELAAAEGSTFLGTCSIFHTKAKLDHPLGPAELPVILRHVDAALKWMSNEVPHSNGLFAPLACPAWLAFRLGQRLNPTVWGRVDYPNFVKGKGYVRALSAPMSRAPWFQDKARLMFMSAEPLDLARTQVGEALRAVQDALELELGKHSERFVFRAFMHANLDDVVREFDHFRPDILHLHMHGSESGEVALVDEKRETERASMRQLISRIKAATWKPSLIVISACHSAEVLGPALRGVAECVVGMQGKAITNKVIAFSKFFYSSLARGNTLTQALEQGRVQAEIEWVQDFRVDEVSDENIVLFPRPV